MSKALTISPVPLDRINSKIMFINIQTHPCSVSLYVKPRKISLCKLFVAILLIETIENQGTNEDIKRLSRYERRFFDAYNS